MARFYEGNQTMYKRSAFYASVLVITLLAFQNCSEVFKANRSPSSELGNHGNQNHRDRDNDNDLAKPIVEATARDLLQSRRLLTSTFNSVFGPGAVALGGGNIDSDRGTFGDPCSIYEEYLVEIDGVRRLEDRTKTCPKGNVANGLTATMYPNPTVVRQAKIRNLCLAAVSNANRLAFVLAKVASGIPQPTEQNILKAFGLFYRLRPSPQPALIDSLRAMTPGTITSKNEWAPIVFTICVSPGWQIL